MDFSVNLYSLKSVEFFYWHLCILFRLSVSDLYREGFEGIDNLIGRGAMLSELGFKSGRVTTNPIVL